MALKEENKDKKSKVYLFVIILILFLINLGLIYNLVTKNNKLTLTQEELVETQGELETVEALRAQLEEDVAKYKGENEARDSIITIREAEIQKKVAEIKALLQKEGVTKSELQRARNEINSLRSKINQLTMEMDSLSKENQYLKDENYVVMKQVEAEKARVKEVESENSDLTAQVKVGQRIFLKSLTATPLRSALIGDFKTTDKLNKLEKLDISYILANNDLSSKGEKTLYFKIQTPSKSTLVDQKSGSGTFNYQGGESLYTLKKVIDFQNSNETGTVSMPKTDGMTPGAYTVIVYSDTHEMGRITFELR